jgi:hypothetical protein
MVLKKYSFLLFCFVLLLSCGKKTTVPTQEVTDDISTFRPKYEAPKENVVVETIPDKKQTNVTFDDDSDLLDPKLEKIRENNKIINTIQGFRIQVYSGTDQVAAETKLKAIADLLPNFKPEIKYFQPNFRVKVGEFYDRLEAQMVFAKVKQYFPEAIIVPEKINIKKKDGN